MMRISTIFILVLGFFCIFSGNSYSDPLEDFRSGVIEYNKAESFDGYNFYTNYWTYAYLMDMTGKVVYRWKFPFSKSPWLYARLLDNGNIVAVSTGRFFAKFDKNSKLIWEIPIAANHDIELLPDGTFLVPVWEPPVEYNNRKIRFDSIVHISKDGRKLGSWSTYKHLKELQKLHAQVYFDTKPGKDIIEKFNLNRSYLAVTPAENIKQKIHLLLYYHLNSIQILPETALGLKNKNFQKGNWLICLRDVNLILILDKDTHKVVWSWGVGVLDKPHMPRMLSNGNILVFDNGLLQRTYSRLVIVNPVSRKIVWEYKANPPESFYSRIEGSSQMLPNGNFLIGEATKGRAFEITPGGKIVWEFLYPVMKNGVRGGFYRMLRIPKEEVSGWLGR